VAVSGNRIVVGAPGTVVGTNSAQGAVHVFDRAGAVYEPTAVLTAGLGRAFDQLGFCVDVDGSVIAAGSWLAGPADQGEVIVFEFLDGQWTERQALGASDSAPFDRFGAAIAVEGNWMVIGTSSAYVYRRDGDVWSEAATLVASDGDANEGFGSAVALSGGTRFVGAELDDVGGNESQGSAYLFELDAGNWIETAKIVGSSGSALDYFGSSIDFDGAVVAIGSMGRGPGGALGSGGFTVLSRSGSSWIEVPVEIPGGEPADFLGASIALSGTTVTLGAPGVDRPPPANGADEGRVLVFTSPIDQIMGVV
jgi:hypothetical protein